MIRRRVGRGRGNDRRVGHCAFAFENVERTRHVGILLTNRDVNTIKRPIILIALFLAGFVQTRLTDDGVDRNRCFAGRAVANNQLALAAADRNHRVDCHDPALDRLADALSFNHARRDLF